MFYFGCGHTAKEAEEFSRKGVIFSASRMDDVERKIRKRHDKLPEHILFDPQLYLLDYNWNLNEAGHQSVIQKACEYPWLGLSEAPDFKSGMGRRKYKKKLKKDLDNLWASRKSPDENWDETVREAIDYQASFTNQPILPAHAITGSGASLDRFTEQTRAAAAIADGSGYLSVVIDATSLGLEPPGEFVESIAEIVLTTNKVKRVYLVLAAQDDYVIERNIAGNFLYLVRLLSSRTEVLVNLVGDLGIVAYDFGAAEFASGYRKKAQRFVVSDFITIDFRPKVYPRFFSPSLMSRIAAERDLVALAKAGISHLSVFASDWTDSSEILKNTLEKRQSTPQNWTSSRGAKAKPCRHHYVDVCAEISNSARRNPLDRLEFARNQLHGILQVKSPSGDQAIKDGYEQVGEWFAGAQLAVKK